MSESAVRVLIDRVVALTRTRSSNVVSAATKRGSSTADGTGKPRFFRSASPSSLAEDAFSESSEAVLNWS